MNNERRLKAEELELLHEVVAKYLSSEAEGLLAEPPDRWLSPLRRRIRDVIGQELAGSGFGANYEPTSRGHLLEGLIDYLNRLEFARQE